MAEGTAAPPLGAYMPSLEPDPVGNSDGPNLSDLHNQLARYVARFYESVSS